MEPSGFIFDFDGVIVDSLKVHIKCWELAHLKLFGTDIGDTSDLPGRSTGVIAKILASRANRPNMASALAEEKKALLRLNQGEIEAMPGALEAFRYLNENNLPFGIASNAPRLFIEQTLQKLGANVKILFGVDDVPLPKPAPDMFLACAKAIGVPFTKHLSTIVFEDSTHGLEAAVKAGMYPIGVETQHTASILLDAGAKKTCKHIAEAFSKGWFHSLI